MKKKHIFTKTDYPHRVKTLFELPKKNLIVSIEIYFTRPENSRSLLERDGQKAFGEYTHMESKDGSLSLGVAKIISEHDAFIYFLECDSKFAEIPVEELEELIHEFEKEFQEKYEIIIRDRATDVLIDRMTDVAVWESF